jgi:hypothetical protein
MDMRPLVIVPLLLLSACTIRNRYSADGPDARPLTAYGLSHGMITVPIVIASGTATGKPMWGALASCAFYLGHETEETRTWSYFEWGLGDSLADVALPCLTGFALNKLLHEWTWWKLWRREPETHPTPSG